MIWQDIQELTKYTGFYVKFRPNIRVSAAILDLWKGLLKKNFRHFVDKSYTDNVTKAFPEIPSGYGAAVNRSAWGYFTSPRRLPV